MKETGIRVTLVALLALAAYPCQGQSLPATPSAPQITVTITSPSDSSQVMRRPTVEGVVSEPNATVWVVVHPHELRLPILHS